MTIKLQDCATIKPLLDAYYDNELTGEEKALVEVHLSACESCPHHLAQIGKLVAVLKTMPAATSKIDFADRFEWPSPAPELTGIASDAKKVIPVRFGWIAAVAASVVVFAGIGQYAMHHDSGTSVANLTPPGATTATHAQRPEGNQVNRALQAERLASNKSEDKDAELTDSGNAAKAPAGESSPQAIDNASTKPVARLKMPRTEVASETGSQVRSRDVVASAPVLDNEGINSSDGSKHSLVAFYASDPNTIPEELGISTDEDGLYAIKM